LCFPPLSVLAFFMDLHIIRFIIGDS